jgi:TonB family protein
MIGAPVVRHVFVMPLIAPPVERQIVKLAPRQVVATPKPIVRPIKVKPVKVPGPSPMVSPPTRIVASLAVRPSPALDIKMPDMKLDAKAAPRLAELPRAEMPAPPMRAPLAAKAPKQVQTGGFGDPNGVRAEGTPGRVSNVASLGAFDLPVGKGGGGSPHGVVGGSGFGDSVAGVAGGSGRGQGHGVVGGSGFGDSVVGVAGGSGHGQGHGVVGGTGFGDASVGGGTGNGGGSRPAAGPSGFDAKPATPQARRREADTVQVPVELVSKPRPDYTDEARRLRIEGEVVLRVMFSASGNLQVLDVIRGLGHGLDENAVRAAEKIRFKPASSDGRPVDSIATVRIVFQLAY